MRPHEQASPATPVVVRNLSYYYRGRAALDDITLVVERGVTGIVGPNGAGKTTLLEILATARRCADEQLELFGTPPRRALHALRRRIGFVPQSMAVPRRATVRDFVTYCAWLKAVPRRERKEHVADALAVTDLATMAHRRLGELSEGTVRRAVVAQAIVNQPDLLLLDEPTTGLDPEQRIRFRELVRRIAADRTVLMSSHLLEDVAHLASTVVVIRDGSLLYNGPVHGLAEHAAHPGATPLGDTALERGLSAVLARGAEA